MSSEATPAPNGASADWARWAILWLTCGGLFGQFYAFDIPSALNEQMQASLAVSTHVTGEAFEYYFGLLYSVYSVPNVVLPLAMGVAVDRCGCQTLIVCLGALVVVGQVVFAMGYGLASWPMMLAGRAIFGLGGESLQVAQNCLLFRWFKGREVAFALGLNLSVARSGSVLNDVLSPWVAREHGVAVTLWFGVALCFGSCVCNVVSVVVDRCKACSASMEEVQNNEEFSPQEVLRMPRLYWLLTALCVILYCGILPFNNIASAFFVETAYSGLPQADAQQRAGYAMSMLFMVSALGTPAFGGLVDMVGYRTHFLLLSSTLLAATYACISSLRPEVATCSLGIVYMIFAGALWPSFALTVPQKQLGTAYGVAVALQNSGLALVPMLVGHLQATAGKGNFHSVMLLFLVLGVVGSMIALQLHADNKARRGVLDLPSSEAEEAFKAGEAAPLQAVKVHKTAVGGCPS